MLITEFEENYNQILLRKNDEFTAFFLRLAQVMYGKISEHIQEHVRVYVFLLNDYCKTVDSMVSNVLLPLSLSPADAVDALSPSQKQGFHSTHLNVLSMFLFGFHCC